jgi:hypothetical protein
MRKVLLIAAVLVASLTMAVNAQAYTKEAVQLGNDGGPYGLSGDCILAAYNICACWIWVFTEAQGAVWGTVLDPDDCPGGCPSGGAVRQIILYSRCDPGPGDFDGVGIASVDALHCLTGSLYDSGPFTTFSCVLGDRWTFIDVPLVHVNGEPFAVTITWGTGTAQMSTDNGIGNLFCSMGIYGTFPGCATTTCTCVGWVMGPQVSYIWITDFNGDTLLDDLCALYGYPYPLSFPYFYPYGYLTNNLLIAVWLDCTSPTAVEPTSWGHVKALYE